MRRSLKRRGAYQYYHRIHGTIPAAIMEVYGNSVLIADGDVTPSVSDHTDYGTTPALTTVTRTFTIQNTGDANLTSLSVSAPSGYTVTVQPSATVAPSGSTTFSVRFDATTNATFAGNITITSNLANYVFAITGIATFIPLLISSLYAWYDSSDANTIYQDSALTTLAGIGDVVGGWKDKTANGNHVIQATTTNKPSRQTVGIRFDGIDNYLRRTFGASQAQPNEIWIVADFNGDITGTAYICGAIDTGNRAEFGINASKYILLAGGGLFTTTITPTNNRTIHQVIFNGASSSVAVNGGAASTGNPGAHNQTGFHIGSRFDLAAWANVDIQEICYFTSAPTAQERTDLLAYLNSKWTVF